jgi:fumarate hydratase subunit beta
MIKLTTPLTTEKVLSLKAGDEVYISGIMYTSRDAGHKKITEQIIKGEELPFDIKNSIIYYVGPSPAREGHVIGSAGPTTSYRMDDYTPLLLELGLKGMVGKGERNQSVIDAMKKHKAIYFGAVGGAGALLASCIKSSKLIAYEELGPEALCELEVIDFPVIVIIDSEGNNMYISEKEKYRTISWE